MRGATVSAGVGKLLLGAGLLILLFVVYQLWGTGLATASSQARLRQQITRELPRSTRSTLAGPSHGSAPSTSAPPTSAPPTSSAPTGAASTPLSSAKHGVPVPVAAMAEPPTGAPVGVLRIPRIGLDMVVVEGVQEKQLAMGPGHYPGTPLPGEAGNASIAGHRTTYLHPFYDLNELRRGDPIDVTTVQGRFVYRVTSSAVVAPSDVAVIAPTEQPELTLTTCNPRYSATTRLIVHAALVAAYPSAAASATAPTHPPAGATRSHGLAGSTGSWGPAAAWGAAVVAATAVTVETRRRLRRRGRLPRWGATAAGTLVVLGLLFVFFEAVTPLLPASI